MKLPIVMLKNITAESESIPPRMNKKLARMPQMKDVVANDFSTLVFLLNIPKITTNMVMRIKSQNKPEVWDDAYETQSAVDVKFGAV